MCVFTFISSWDWFSGLCHCEERTDVIVYCVLISKLHCFVDCHNPLKEGTLHHICLNGVAHIIPFLNTVLHMSKLIIGYFVLMLFYRFGFHLAVGVP